MQPAFSRSNGPELWVLLLEKAYAKMHGDYFTIEGGDPAIALRDLTGAGPIRRRLRDQIVDHRRCRN